MTTVNRRKFLKAASAATTGLAATSVAAPAIAQSMPEIKWRQTTSWPKSLDTLYGGAVLQPFSQEVMDGCHKAALELYDELNKSNPAFKKLYESYKAFQDDGYLWHQVADFTMDHYMIRYRNQKT